MAFKHGKSTAVYLGAVDLSPYLNSFDLSADLDIAETTAYGTTWKSGLPGIPGAKVDFGGMYDPGESSVPTLLTALTPGVLTYCPGGAAAIGDRARLASAYAVSYGESSPVGGIVAIKGTFDNADALGFGDVLHVLGADTNTTTGSSKDDGAATATGWIAHLHVTAVGAGTWTVKLEDSANNSAWADVTGGAFTATAAATSERIASAGLTTALRRYVRYTATRAGGTAGDTITFFLAYARNR